MSNVETLSAELVAERLNVTDRLAAAARNSPQALAIVCPARWSPKYACVRRGTSAANYATTTFGALDADATRIARGLATWGVPQGTRLALLVRPGIDFVALVFGLLRAGMVVVLVDPGLGRKNLIRCLAEARPEGFVAVSLAQAARLWLRRKFPLARWNVTVGKRWFWGGITLPQLREIGTQGSSENLLVKTHADDSAAIIFTSGSTGPPKGVLYTQRMFDTQVAEIQRTYDIQPGGVDLACFPLFALFNSAMGVTTVLPEMDFSRPASANPKTLVATANDWQVTQAFASPAVWRMLGEYCAKTSDRISTLKQVFSCGAPVHASVLRSTLACVAANATMHTPYGMTESLPVATIEAAEVLGETAARTDIGGGVCVGRRFESIDWRIIRITDDPIESIGDCEELAEYEIGELIVRGPQVSPRYVTRTLHNASTKIMDQRAGPSTAPTGGGDTPAHCNKFGQHDIWHRTGDVGYLDEHHRFWYCGRKSQRVETALGPLYTECVEAVFNSVPMVRRSALVGVGPRGRQVPAIFVELEKLQRTADWHLHLKTFASAHAATQQIEHFFDYPSLPVDIRHNAKINREFLTDWAAKQIPSPPSSRL